MLVYHRYKSAAPSQVTDLTVSRRRKEGSIDALNLLSLSVWSDLSIAVQAKREHFALSLAILALHKQQNNPLLLFFPPST